MKVYIAGASKEVLLIETLRNDLVRAGCEITYDWTISVRANSARPDSEIAPAERASYAALDLAGVEMCDLFWLVTPAQPSVGSFVELGAALSLRARTSEPAPRVVISGPWRTIFGDLADANYPTHEEALAAITAEQALRVTR